MYLYPFIALSDTESGPDWEGGEGGLAKPSPSLPIFVHFTSESKDLRVMIDTEGPLNSSELEFLNNLWGLGTD